MFAGFFIPLLLSAAAAAQSTTVCVAGQCLTGQSNISFGATVTSGSTSVHLLPGQYTSSITTSPLREALISTQSTVIYSDGFGASTQAPLTLPLNVALQPGLVSYPSSMFGGRGVYVPLASSPNTTSLNGTGVQPGSMFVSSNSYAAIESTVGGTKARVVVWDAIPDFGQLPVGSVSGALSLVDLQFSTCSPSCSSAGVCSSSGQCVCKAGFTGPSCETCAAGHFGPNCQPCPSGCTSCDEGPTGTGVCLSPASSASAPSTCNCLNGVCGGNGQCTCNPGWANSSNGTACATCATGFFQAANGECQLCQNGCTACSANTGICTQCATGFTPDANDRTKCIPTPTTGAGGAACPDGSFGNGSTCNLCSPLCKTCRGPLASDCTVCGPGRYNLNGACVATDSSGVCTGSSLVANNVKNSCDSCPSKCTACNIPNFTGASTFDQVQCTRCLPGFVLSGGKCLERCPAGQFVSPADGLTCTACDSTCATCAGDSKFCLTCSSPNQSAFNGSCTASCPANTFNSNGACLPCHADCATCSGPGFNQCTTCSASRPVPQSGRCAPTCSKSEFFDVTSSSCKPCDSSCSSCSAAGSAGCLACANPKQTLRAGTCVDASCGEGPVVPELGVCLSQLVITPKSPPPPPPVPINPVDPPAPVRIVEWWQILLMIAGGLFFVGLFAILWRRRARRLRAKQTAAFAKELEAKRSSMDFFGFGKKSKAGSLSDEEERLEQIRDAEAYLHANKGAMSQYSYSSSRRPSFNGGGYGPPYSPRALSQRSAPSIYSQVTSQSRKLPEPRQPVRENSISRFSMKTSSSSRSYRSHQRKNTPPLPIHSTQPTEAEAYKMATLYPQYWNDSLTGNSKVPNTNPFRNY